MALLDYAGLTTFKEKFDEQEAGIIADVYSESSTYAVGAYVLYENKLYRCTTAVSTAGAWTGVSNWTLVTVDDELTQLKDSLTGLRLYRGSDGGLCEYDTTE